jgi:hypothetical protein
MKLWWGDPRVTGEKLSNSEWDIDQTNDWVTTQYDEDLPSAFGTTPVSHLSATFKISRKPRYMVWNYVIQAIFIYGVSWVGLWIDRAAVPARAAVGVIPVLVITNKMSALATALPPISYATRLESFMVMSLFMISFNMVEYGMVHFATRMTKMYADRAKPDEAGEGDGKNKPPVKTIGWRLVSFLNAHFETHMRWLSPLVYAVAAGSILGLSRED